MESGSAVRFWRRLCRRIVMSSGVEPVWKGHLSGPAWEQYVEKLARTLSVSWRLAFQPVE